MVNVVLPSSIFARPEMPAQISSPSLTPSLIRAARGLLNLSQSDLADIVLVSTRTILSIENDKSEEGEVGDSRKIGPDERKRVDARRRAVLGKIRRTLEADFGIELIFANTETGEGVRLRHAVSRAELAELKERLVEPGRTARLKRLEKKDASNT
jgi:transcriptional regulator with XRE-family HTH domain